jgi:hypothetical protein
MALRINTRVKSFRVGARKAFIGVIAEKCLGSKGGYHVRDKHGQLWHRTRHEIERVTSGGKNA